MPSSYAYQRLALDESVALPYRSKRSWALHGSHFILTLILSAAAYYAGRHADHSAARPSAVDLACFPSLPNLFAGEPPSPYDTHFLKAAKAYRRALDGAFAGHPIDGLSVAVVTSAGQLFEGHWGHQRANESEPTISVMTGMSQYRVASVSKLLLVYGAWVLEQRGVISWDDRVDKHLPAFRPNYTSFSPYPAEYSPITLRDLASHLSGLGHDWPVGSGSNFPHDRHGRGPPPNNGRPFPSHDDVFNAIQSTPLVSPPGLVPVYSNTAFGVLGMALVAANRARGGDTEPTTVAELMRRDVFAPLGMEGTHYLATENNSHLVVVPSFGAEIIDMDFLDALNPSGGMFTSLTDLSKFVTALLDSSKGPLSRSTIDRWLRPVHVFDEDDWTATGVVWEMFKHIDSHGRRRYVYVKLGELGVMHAAVAVNPATGYGVVILMSGVYSDAAGLAYAAFDAFQPAFDSALTDRATRLYSGKWRAPTSNSTTEARIAVRQGSLWIENYVLRGTPVLQHLYGLNAAPLRSTGRRDEFRLDIGVRRQNGLKHRGCMPHWAAFDDHGMRHGAAVTLISFTGDGDRRRLHVPAAEIEMTRF
ncbi:beta-lactamase/transpeptidase-like protein [Exidia glandulosa HHB12029]|uniref:Beta-lactamase/transpeptidase-like protein n=1 Tax=Exidia glandulosa HHB12029 TaxID=1314781 RepID=A0A165KJC6_EXIGL|nr:beta-lactamase/transpeptidase-like protein [Exidia glandulosa HHB12029]